MKKLLCGCGKDKNYGEKNITNDNLLRLIHIEKQRTLNRAAKQK